MLTAFAFIAVILTVYFFARDMGEQQLINSRFDSFYKPFTAETIVLHEYLAKPEIIWKAITSFENYHLWFPDINRILPVLDAAKYVHRFSFDRFTFEPGAFIKLRPRSFLPWFKCRILGLEPNKKLEMEMRFNPVNKEIVSFEINITRDGFSEVVCIRRSSGFFSFFTTWGFADKGSAILNNLSHFLPEDHSNKGEKEDKTDQEAGPILNRETIIAQAVQAGLDDNMDLINAITDKPTRGLAKAALVKSKRLGGLPDHLAKALKDQPLSALTGSNSSQSGLPGFTNDDDLIAYVVNKALDGDMDPINSIPDKPLRGKAKSAMVKAKRTGERPSLPRVPISSSATASPDVPDETEEALINRLVAAGVQGNMDEINSLENKALRGKIKAAVLRAKRSAK